MAEAWRVERTLNRRTLTTAYAVKRGDEFLRMAGRFTTIRRFRTEAGAQRACDKANAAHGVAGTQTDEIASGAHAPGNAGEPEPRMAFCPACFVEVTQEQADAQTNAARVLAEFARTAPGRLPSRVQEALAVVEGASGVPVDAAQSQTMTVAELARRSGVKALTVMDRIKEWGGGDVTLNQPINLIGLATAALAHGVSASADHTFSQQTPMPPREGSDA